MTKRPAKKPKSPVAPESARRRSRSEKPRGERVIRHDLLAVCHIALPPDTREKIGKKAHEALIATLKRGYGRCVVQCEGYVFNVAMATLFVPAPEPKSAPSTAAG